MVVKALTAAQRQSLADLVAGRRIEAVPVDSSRAAAFLASAAERISQLPLLTSPAVSFDVAYDAAHDVGEAILAAYGFRTTNGPGQHEAVGRLLKAVIDSPPHHAAASEFDRLRRLRNQGHYGAAPRSAADAAKAKQIAEALYSAGVACGVGT